MHPSRRQPVKANRQQRNEQLSEPENRDRVREQRAHGDHAVEQTTTTYGRQDPQRDADNGGETERRPAQDQARAEQKRPGYEPASEEEREISRYASSTLSSTRRARRRRTAPSHRPDRTRGSRCARSKARCRPPAGSREGHA